MLDLSAARRAPLPNLAPTASGVSFSLVPASTRLSYRGADGAAIAGTAFGLTLPAKPCTSAIAGGRAALWLGPDEWLLLAPETETLSVQQALTDALADTPHAIVDISHRQIGFRLDGPGAATLLNSGVPLDLSLAAFPVGMVTRTIFEKAEIILWRTDTDSFHIEVWRSFAPYIVALLSGPH